MSRNGSGTYSLPSGNPVVTGTTISSTTHNTTMSDIATALTTSLASDGQTTPTANLPMGGYKHTGVANGSARTDYASLGQVQDSTAQLVTVTGTDTILATSSPAVVAYATGQTFRFVSAGANTGAATFNLNSLGAKAITKNGATALSAGDISSGAVVHVTYDGTQFQLANVASFTGGPIQTQSYTRFTAGGTADAITGTLAPAIGSYVAGLRVTTTLGGANTVTGPTLNLNSLGTKTIKKRDSGGTKVALVAGDYNASGPFDFEYDGTDFILLNPLPAAVTSNSSVPVRQTVLSGPVDSSGFSAFGGSTGSTTVTASGTLKATAAAGGDANYTGSIVNPSWTGLSTNGTMFLYLDITSGGVVTTGSTTLEPTYQWGGTYSTTNLQNTFNIQEMTMKAGNGSTASQVYRVFVGEVTVAGGVTTAITWYALMGRYDSGWISTIPGVTTLTSKNSNIGVPAQDAALEIKCLTAELGYSIGDVIRNIGTTPAAVYVPIGVITTAKTIAFMTGNSSVYVQNKSTGAVSAVTVANWAYRLFTRRAW